MRRVPPQVERNKTYTRLQKENGTLEKAVMRLLLERDRALAEVDACKRRELIYRIPKETSHEKNVGLYKLLDRVVSERNILQEQYAELKHNFEMLLADRTRKTP